MCLRETFREAWRVQKAHKSFEISFLTKLQNGACDFQPFRLARWRTLPSLTTQPPDERWLWHVLYQLTLPSWSNVAPRERLRDCCCSSIRKLCWVYFGMFSADGGCDHNEGNNSKVLLLLLPCAFKWEIVFGKISACRVYCPAFSLFSQRNREQ